VAQSSFVTEIMNMHKTVLLRLFLLFAISTGSLSAIKGQDNWFRNIPADSMNFYSIVRAANDHFGTEGLNFTSGTIEENDHLKFKRWEWFWRTRINEDGSFPDPRLQTKVYSRLQENQSLDRGDLTSPWTNISQTHSEGGYSAMGRTSSIAFHPADVNTFYVGAAIGGVWKTEDGGQSYTALGDALPYLSNNGVLIDYNNPEILYIILGGKVEFQNYGLGIYKSTDAGLTWDTTGMQSNFTDGIAYHKMIMNPSNNEEIFVVLSNGIYRTQDAGTTWEMVKSGEFRDIIYRPESDQILYAASYDYWGGSEVFMSTDGGTSWDQITSLNIQGNSIHLSVTPDDPEYLLVGCDYNDETEIWLSEDGGATFNQQGTIPEGSTVQISALDKNIMYGGHLTIYQSFDSGWSWEQLTQWWDGGEYPTVHADQRYIAINPLNNEIYFCNDGGIEKYNEVSGNWNYLSDGLIITQFYDIAVSQQDDFFMIGGTQDNGGRKRVSNNQWAPTNGGDAMTVAVNSENDQTIYTTYIYGRLYRSYDQWDNDQYYEITPPEAAEGEWVTPYVLSPQNPYTIVAGYDEVFKSEDEGETWEAISDGIFTNSTYRVKCLAIAPSDDDVIYAGRGARVYVTTNGGDTWSNYGVYTAGTNGTEVTSITVHPTQPAKIWVTVAGYNATKKVFYSENYGDDFINLTLNLPNTPVNTGEMDYHSGNLDYYIGTDVGIFILNNVSQQWDYYGSGVPNTPVTDLEIQYDSRKIYAATHGRGIWVNDLFSEQGVSVNNIQAEYNNWVEVAGNPIGETMRLNIHSKIASQSSIRLFDSTGNIVFEENRILPSGHYQWSWPANNLSAGMYYLSVQGESFSPVMMKVVKR
jgi:photosystem II stability/assembly factor-like uncharacterized protein